MMKEGIPSQHIPLNVLRGSISAPTSSAEVPDMDKKSEFMKLGEIPDKEFTVSGSKEMGEDIWQ